MIGGRRFAAGTNRGRFFSMVHRVLISNQTLIGRALPIFPAILELFHRMNQSADFIGDDSGDVSMPVMQPRSPTAPARLTSRTRTVAGADGRVRGVRRVRDTELALAAEFFGCEPSALLPSQRIAVSTVAALRLRLDDLRTSIATGQAIDDENLTRVANLVGRELGRLERQAALAKKAKGSGGPDALRAYLAAKAAEAAA